MTENEIAAPAQASVEEIQRGWFDLTSRIAQLEQEASNLEAENKSLRFLLERVVEHRQKSHSELVLLITNLVSKMPMTDLGVLLTKLVEHNENVSHSLAAFLKGAAEADLPQPALLKRLEQTKRDLAGAVKPIVEELIQLDTPIETEMLKGLLEKPDQFFSPRMARANRCFIKGQVPRERIVREFGDGALLFFNDMTTDPKANPHPKLEEIALAFKSDFETLFQQNGASLPNQGRELTALYQRVQRSKGNSDTARAQKHAFQRLSFIAEVLFFYQNQNTEAPDAVFAQRLPSLIEQLVLSGPQETPDEKSIAAAENLLAYVIRPDHRQMVINNVGKGGGSAKTLRYVLKLRAETAPELGLDQVIPEFIKHLIPPSPNKPPPPAAIASVLRLLSAEMQTEIVKFIMRSDKISKEDSQALARGVATELGFKEMPQLPKGLEGITPEIERQLAWANITALINRRTDAAVVAAAIRERLHAHYDADEIRQSWVTLIEADAISLIRIFCQIPYTADGKTDPIARTVMETYVTRLTHEKYAGIYSKVVNSLRNMFNAKPDSPTLLNFTGLVKWVSPEAAARLAADIGMPAVHG
jgi:hypothetical protein